MHINVVFAVASQLQAAPHTTAKYSSGTPWEKLPIYSTRTIFPAESHTSCASFQNASAHLSLSRTKRLISVVSDSGCYESTSRKRAGPQQEEGKKAPCFADCPCRHCRADASRRQLSNAQKVTCLITKGQTVDTLRRGVLRGEIDDFDPTEAGPTPAHFDPVWRVGETQERKK